jgi:hypothetical protein
MSLTIPTLDWTYLIFYLMSLFFLTIIAEWVFFYILIQVLRINYMKKYVFNKEYYKRKLKERELYSSHGFFHILFVYILFNPNNYKDKLALLIVFNQSLQSLDKYISDSFYIEKSITFKLDIIISHALTGISIASLIFFKNVLLFIILIKVYHFYRIYKGVNHFNNR